MDWVKQLKEKLKHCLHTYIPNGKYPLLFDFYMTYMSEDIENFQNKLKKMNFVTVPLQNNIVNVETSNNNNNNNNQSNNVSNLNIHEDDYKKLIEDYYKIKKKEEAAKITLIESQKKWTNFSLDILNISFELINNFKKVQSGIEVSNNFVDTMNTKLLKYEAFLKKNAEELDKNKSMLKKDKSELLLDKVNNNNTNPLNTSNNEKQQYYDNSMREDMNIENISHIKNQSIHLNYDINHILDFPVVKADLAKVNSFHTDTAEFYERVVFILREIRLRITRRKQNKIKQLTLYALIHYDLFGLKSKYVKIYYNLLNNNK
jgi:hypothetical protein